MRLSGRTSPHRDRTNTQQWVDFLRATHPDHTAKRVARHIGIPVRTVEKWLAGETVPNAGALIALIEGYGPEFLAAWMPVTAPWLAAAARAERRAKIEAELKALSALADALADA